MNLSRKALIYREALPLIAAADQPKIDPASSAAPKMPLAFGERLARTENVSMDWFAAPG